MGRRRRRKPLWLKVARAIGPLAMCGAFIWFPKQSMALLMIYGMHKIAPYMHMLDPILHR